MNTRFVDRVVVQKDRYAIGDDVVDKSSYLAIPVSNSRVDYEEYYRLTGPEAKRFIDDPAEAAAFADACRAHRHDDRLVLQPGSDRGVPV